jgi:hypothetical protein
MVTMDPRDPRTWRPPSHWGPAADGDWTFASLAGVAVSILEASPECAVSLDIEHPTCINLRVMRGSDCIGRVYVSRASRRSRVARYSARYGPDRSFFGESVPDVVSHVLSATGPLRRHEIVQPQYPARIERLRDLARRCSCVANEDDFEVFFATLSPDDIQQFARAYELVTQPEENDALHLMVEQPGSHALLLAVTLDRMIEKGVIPDARERLIRWDTREFDDQGNEW